MLKPLLKEELKIQGRKMESLLYTFKASSRCLIMQVEAARCKSRLVDRINKIVTKYYSMPTLPPIEKNVSPNCELQ